MDTAPAFTPKSFDSLCTRGLCVHPDAVGVAAILYTIAADSRRVG
jgi:hypothetical protein